MFLFNYSISNKWIINGSDQWIKNIHPRSSASWLSNTIIVKKHMLYSNYEVIISHREFLQLFNKFAGNYKIKHFKTSQEARNFADNIMLRIKKLAVFS